MEIVIAAVVAQAGAVFVAYLGLRKHQKDNVRGLTTLTRKIQTNNGMEPFQYLEMVADVKAGQDAVIARINAVVDIVAEHTVADEVNFRKLERRLHRIENNQEPDPK